MKLIRHALACGDAELMYADGMDDATAQVEWDAFFTPDVDNGLPNTVR